MKFTICGKTLQKSLNKNLKKKNNFLKFFKNDRKTKSFEKIFCIFLEIGLDQLRNLFRQNLAKV